MEYFDETVDVVCPDCEKPLRFEISVGFQPTFMLHDRGARKKSCRICYWRHPRTRAVVVRVVPEYLLFRDYLPVVVAELRAIAGKAGLL